MNDSNSYRAAGAALLALSIGLGAFGAHGLKNLLPPPSLESYRTGVEYLMFQSLGLLALQHSKWVAWLLLAGTACFSGSIFLLSTQSLHGLPVSWLGPITPIGGLLLMLAWGLCAYQLFISKSEKSAVSK